jgi:polyphenol oxidase
MATKNHQGKLMNWFCDDTAGLKKYRASILNDATIVQAVSSRDYGNMALHTGDFPAQVIANRKRFLTSLGLGLDNLVVGEQTHSTTIQVISRQEIGSGALLQQTALPKTDALITRERNVVLGIFTADCLPIFIYDPKTPAIAVIHAGWRGTIAKIVRLTMDKMIHDFQTDPGNCRVAIGPSICPACFTVSLEVANAFYEVNPEVVNQAESGYQVDLSDFNFRLLQASGVKPQNIVIADLCTGCHNENFFSYRIEKGTLGRMMGIIALQ